MRRLYLLLLLLLLSSLIISATSVSFTCTGTRSTCNAMIGYISPNKTTLSTIQTLFQVHSIDSLLAANSWTTSGNSSARPIAAGSTVRIPFPCSCSGGTGVSDRTPVYSVKKDDGLFHIASEIFGAFVTYQEIAAANNIPDPNLIQIGQNLSIPLPCSCDDVGGARAVHYGHVVANGSTVAQIAGEFGTTEDTLMTLNKNIPADPKELKAGQILDVPLKACNSTIDTTSLDSSLVIPNGSYALTANNCIRCNCSSNLKLQCSRAQGVTVSNWTQCPSIQCSGTLSLGESSSSTCLQTTCDYAGYTNTKILTVLNNQSTCSTPANSAAPWIGGNWRNWSTGLFLSFVFGLLCLNFP